jgi:hypothetical protein
MDATNNVTVSPQFTNRRPTSAQRRAAEAASLTNKQAQLKQEAAERRAQRATQDTPAASAAVARGGNQL